MVKYESQLAVGHEITQLLNILEIAHLKLQQPGQYGLYKFSREVTGEKLVLFQLFTKQITPNNPIYPTPHQSISC